MKLRAADLRALKGSLCAALIMIVGGAAAVQFALAANSAAGRLHAAAQAQRNELDGKLRRVRSEENEIRAKAATFDALMAAGVVGEERRLEWIELINEIRDRRRLPGLRYEISAQRALDPGSAPQSGFAFHVSTMKLQARLLHEEDLTRLLADLHAKASALLQVRSCVLSPLAPGREPPAQLAADCEIDWITLRNVAGAEKPR